MRRKIRKRKKVTHREMENVRKDKGESGVDWAKAVYERKMTFKN